MLTNKLAEQLPQFDAKGILAMDDGNNERRINGLIRDAMENISRYPFTGNGKVEKRVIEAKIIIVPELREINVPVEVGGGRVNQVKSYELAGAIVQVVLKAGNPVAKSNVVRLACEVKNQKIVAAHFNPNNNDAPEQLELDLDDEE